MKTVFKLKDLVKYIVFIGVVYALFKLIPSQPFNQRDLILIVSVISFGFIFIDCYSRTEGFSTMGESDTIAKPLTTAEFNQSSVINDPTDQDIDVVDQESDVPDEESDVAEESDVVDQESDIDEDEVEQESETVNEESETVNEESETNNQESRMESKAESRMESKAESRMQPRMETKIQQRVLMEQNNIEDDTEDGQSVVDDSADNDKVDLNINSKYEKLRQEYYSPKQEKTIITKYQNPKQEKTIMNKYQNVLNKTNSTNNVNTEVKSIITNTSEQKRFQEADNISASNGNPQSAGCGVEMEKLKREVSKHIGELEDKIKSLENQPINENMEKYKNYLMKDLAEVGILDQIDIDNFNSKLENNIMSIEEAISKLENLKLRSKPRVKLNKVKNESDYNELPNEFYDKLGDPNLSKWDTAFHMLDTNKWQVPMPRPPVCINTSPCKVCPEVDETGSNSLKLKDWDYARKVMNLTVNKDWANDQMDVNTSVPLNVQLNKKKKVYQYDDIMNNQESAKPHPPLKTGGLIPYNSDKPDKSNLPSLNNVRRKVSSKNKINPDKTAQVQSFRNVDNSNEYVRKYKARFN
jgi:hypothetical protein